MSNSQWGPPAPEHFDPSRASAEHIALTIAKGMVERGDGLPPNIAFVCVAALTRYAEGEDAMHALADRVAERAEA